MTQTTNHAATPQQINADAFINLSRISLSSIERLTALNLNTTRATFENNIAASSSALQAKGDQDKQKAMAALPADAASSMVAYLQGVQEIASDTQKELAKLMAVYFLPKNGESGMGANWQKGMDLFKNLGQQMTDLSKANSDSIVEAADTIASASTAAAKKHA